jgi:TRAP-type C4-dicarboxylate transport system permease small subunit
MDKKQSSMIATMVTALLCGCPGLCLCLFGGLTIVGLVPYNPTWNGYTQSGVLPAGWGFAMLCLALILIAIPVVVGFVTLRKPAPVEGVIVDEEPLPPTF